MHSGPLDDRQARGPWHTSCTSNLHELLVVQEKPRRGSERFHLLFTVLKRVLIGFPCVRVYQAAVSAVDQAAGASVRVDVEGLPALLACLVDDGLEVIRVMDSLELLPCAEDVPT